MSGALRLIIGNALLDERSEDSEVVDVLSLNIELEAVVLFFIFILVQLFIHVVILVQLVDLIVLAETIVGRVLVGGGRAGSLVKIYFSLFFFRLDFLNLLLFVIFFVHLSG